jgi:hypothetical protein
MSTFPSWKPLIAAFTSFVERKREAISIVNG